MPRKPRRGCAYGFCPNLAEEGSAYCAEHKAMERNNYNEHRRGYRSSERYNASWHKIRKLYVNKHPLCERCLKDGRYTAVQEVHHIVPISQGGDNSDDNLMSLCRSCHQKIHQELGDR